MPCNNNAVIHAFPKLKNFVRNLMTLNALWCIILKRREKIFLFTYCTSHIKHDANIACRDNTLYGLFPKTTYSVTEDKDENALK